MSKALSLDLRTRVLAAIGGGLWCRQAAQRFGVSASSAIRWRALERTQGDARPKALGGDRRSGRVEERAGLILALVEETPDITLEELRTALAGRGLTVGFLHALRLRDVLREAPDNPGAFVEEFDRRTRRR